jgi:hypothetical protein
MNWQIVKQDGDEIKQVKCYPNKDKKTGEIMSWGRLGNSCFRLLFAHKLEPNRHWKVCYTKHGFNITCPNRLVPVSQSATEKEYKEVPGRAFKGKATSGSMNLQKFMVELKEQCGEEFAQQIVGLFVNAMSN